MCNSCKNLKPKNQNLKTKIHVCKCELNSIEKPKPKINMNKMENKYVNDPLYNIFGKQYLQKKNNM